MFGQIERGKYGNYVLRDGDRHIALADLFGYGIDFEEYIGKQGYVNAVYHVVGNRLIPHPANFFEEVTDGVASTRLLKQEASAGKTFTIDGRKIADMSSAPKGIVIKNGKKIIK